MVTRDRIGALILLALSISYGIGSFQIPLLPFQAQAAFTARTMPQALSVLGVLLSLALLFKPAGNAGPEVAGFRWGQAALVCLLMIAYGLTVRPGGFLISTVLFLLCGFFILGERRWGLMVIAAVPLVILFWALMTQVLGVFIEPWPALLRGG